AMLLADAHELAPALEQPTRPRPDQSELLTTLAQMHAHREPAGLEGSGYVPPSNAELSLLEQEIVAPLVRWAQHWELGIGPPATVAVWAAELDYELVELGDCRGRRGDERADSCVLILRERWRRSTAGWGTLLLR